MFIDRTQFNYQFRSEERKATRLLPFKRVPLLRTELVGLGSQSIDISPLTG